MDTLCFASHLDLAIIYSVVFPMNLWTAGDRVDFISRWCHFKGSMVAVSSTVVSSLFYRSPGYSDSATFFLSSTILVFDDRAGI
jgi:hypothetical protein